MSKADNCTTPIRPSNVAKFPTGVSRKPTKAAPVSQKCAAASAEPSRDAVRRRYKSDDPIFFEIERHRHAAKTYKKLIDAYGEAEETGATDEELAEQDLCIEQAFNYLYPLTRCLVITSAKSRAGLIALAQYIEQLFEPDCPYMPERPGTEPWPQVLMRSMAKSLRKIGKDFPPAKRARKGRISSKAAQI